MVFLMEIIAFWVLLERTWPWGLFVLGAALVVLRLINMLFTQRL